MIVFRPNYDITTKYISAWAEEIIEFAKTKGVEAVDLSGEKANRKDFEGRIKKLKETKVVFLNGHGSKNNVCGQNGEVVVNLKNCKELLGGKITYALSCESAKKLGKEVSNSPDSAYIGYTDEFVFILSQKYLSKPLEDSTAKPFKESSNQVMISLLKGNTAEESSKKAKNKFYENLIKLASSAANPDSIHAMKCLRWNMIHQVCLGKKEASI